MKMPNRVAGRIALPAPTIPQLLRPNVWAILPLVMKGPTTVFTHRGLSPHQFTPMSGAHKITGVNAGGPRPFTFDFRTGIAGSVQRQCIRHALEWLLEINELVFQGTADTLLNVGRRNASITL